MNNLTLENLLEMTDEELILVFQKENEENNQKSHSEELVEEEFSAEESEIDEDFNQEVEEELLDIPTFLRRQAN